MDKKTRPEINSLEYWKISSVTDEKKIARAFGYAFNTNFSKALENFIRDRVEESMIEDFLRPLAIGYFGNWKPPLERVQGAKEEKLLFFEKDI